MQRNRARRAGSHAETQQHNRKNDKPFEAFKESPNQHSHLDQFLRDQILSQKSGGHSKNGKTTVSCSATRKNNSLIEMAAKKQYSARRHKNSGNSTARAENQQEKLGESTAEKEQ